MQETGLSTTEQSELARQEAVIERGLHTFVEVGLALTVIRDARLYRLGHATFAEYCRDRWKMDRQRAYQLIEAAQVVENVKNVLQIEPPQNDSQARELAKVREPEAQRAVWQRVIETAPDGVVTTAFVKQVVREMAHEARAEPPPFPTGKASVLYADPPWAYDNSGFDQSAASHYPTMATDAICALPVASLCTPDTVLFLWTTSPLLDQAFRVIEAWGFTYKAGMVWDKGEAPGIGWFIKTQHEHLLIATRAGNPHPATRPLSVFREAPGRHSAKPIQVYAMIEAMYPGPYCELFARHRKEGWEAWGNEV